MLSVVQASAAPIAAPAKLRVKGVSVSFERDGQPMPVLDDVNLHVNEGEFLCILGPSGCGKSTLLSAMGGFLIPPSGEIRIDEQIVRGPDPRRIFVFQERGVFPWLTVTGNIAFGLHRLAPADRQQRVTHYINMVGLQGFEQSYPAELSGGMKQRLEVARALAVNPDVLFLDEPFSALDSITRLTMRKELLRIWQAERKTIVLVTHDIDEAIQLADHVILLTSRPATVQEVVSIPVEHPRDTLSADYLALRAHIARKIGLPERI